MLPESQNSYQGHSYLGEEQSIAKFTRRNGPKNAAAESSFCGGALRKTTIKFVTVQSSWKGSSRRTSGRQFSTHVG